jgi:DNA-binding transcriptional regulator LsrR (DeoR family)
MQAIPNVVAVGYQAEKADGIHSVLSGTLVNTLITHTDLAQALLRQGE